MENSLEYSHYNVCETIDIFQILNNLPNNYNLIERTLFGIYIEMIKWVNDIIYEFILILRFLTMH